MRVQLPPLGRVAYLLFLPFLLTEPYLGYGQTAASPSPKPMCWYACNDHCGEVVQCISDQGLPTSTTCEPCDREPSTPGLVDTVTPPCAETARSFLKLNNANPHYFTDNKTGRPVIIASFNNIIPTSDVVQGFYTDQIDLLPYATPYHYSRIWHLLPNGPPEVVYWPWAQTSIEGACYDPKTEGPKFKWDLRWSGGEFPHILGLSRSLLKIE